MKERNEKKTVQGQEDTQLWCSWQKGMLTAQAMAHLSIVIWNERGLVVVHKLAAGWGGQKCRNQVILSAEAQENLG